MFLLGATRLLPFLITFLLQWQLSSQQECSESVLCGIGCCSESGFCGFGPDYCGDGCLSGCDRKADCNPGWDSSEWSLSETCPLNVCCSEFGFCGVTEEFCGDDDKVERPSCSISDTRIDRVIGYYEAWSMTERSCFGMLPEEIPYGYYTHLNFAFATIDPQTFEIVPGDFSTESLMQRIGSIKLLQPDIEIWVAVGGWTFNDPGPTATTFSDIAASADATDAFIDSLVKLMNKYDFDGLDLDWEYPVAKDRSGRDEDFDNFVTLMSKIRKRLQGSGLKKGLSLTLPSSYWYLQHFDIKNLEEHVDWFNIMSYDIHGSWDIDNDWTGPYANSHTNLTEIQDALDLLWRNDINPDKVVMGMAYYTRSFTLVDPSCSDPGCLVASAGKPGRCSETTGVLLHAEIQEMIKEHGVTPVMHREAAVKTVSWEDQWVSFDDAATWRLKANQAREQCISGVMVWAISQDDSDATNVKALTSAIGRTRGDLPGFTLNPPSEEMNEGSIELCRWSGCATSCPSGFKEVKRDGTDLTMTDHTFCSPGRTSRFCCPADQPAPICLWRGHRNSGWCSPGCEDDEVEVGSLAHGCNIRHQSACCKPDPSVDAYGECKWVGEAPVCKVGGGAADCPGDYPFRILSNEDGAGGEQTCTSGSKSYCCKNPAPKEFTVCKWSRTRPHPLYCEDVCPSGQIKLASRWAGADCFQGAEAFCCEPPKPPKNEPRDDDPYGFAGATEFRLLIQKYMENPTCPATILEPPLHDWWKSKSVEKRDLELEAREFEVLMGRATDCTMDNWVRLLQWATVLFTTRDSALDVLSEVWDDEFAGYFDSGLQYDSLSDFINDFDAIDPSSLLEYVLWNPQVAGQGLRRGRHATEVFCDFVVPEEDRRRERDGARHGHPASALSARYIFAYDATDTDVPDLTTIFQGILDNDLPLEYARWQWMSGSRSTGGTRAGPFLELAYRIPPGSDNDRYRDMREDYTRNGGPDRWVVFHLHANAMTSFLRNIDGTVYFGVERITVFHGFDIWVPATENQAWRVLNGDNGEGGRNQRSGFRCPELEGRPTTLWVGAPRDVDHLENDFETAFAQWTYRLFDEGYVARPGQELILEPAPRLPDGQIDPQYYHLVTPGDTYIPPGEPWTPYIDPYRVNWLVQENGELNFNVPAPE